jgi:hypothetical protein
MQFCVWNQRVSPFRGLTTRWWRGGGIESQNWNSGGETLWNSGRNFTLGSVSTEYGDRCASSTGPHGYPDFGGDASSSLKTCCNSCLHQKQYRAWSAKLPQWGISMNIFADARKRARIVAGTMAALAVLMIAFGSSAFAALGGDESSVQNDGVQMKAAKPPAVLQTTQNYTVHEITTPYRTVVREYVSPAGKVFGVAWRGPFMPSLQQIFGSYYQEFAQASTAARDAQVMHSRGAPVRIDQPDLVVRSGGHVRAYVGWAYVPSLVPQGVDPESIK